MSRYFFSSGEPSGELSATVLAQAIAAIDRSAQFEGIGSDRMRAAGFTLWRDNAGWAGMGPLEAIPRIPKLLLTMYATAAHLCETKPDLVVLVDFGAFNVRLAQRLRALGYEGAILDVFPPATWLDDERRARTIASLAVPLTAFAHQRDFYRSLGLDIAYFGHPLAARYTMRPPREAPPADAGTVAILPGSRASELRRHGPRLFKAFRLLKAHRPKARAVVGAADRSAERALRSIAIKNGVADAAFVRGTVAAAAAADAAWVASGTAVLECVLSGVPAIALYVISSVLVRHARRVYSGRFITLPNLVMQREIVPEFLQRDATPGRLAGAMERLLADPAHQYVQFAELRRALGPGDALERCAAFAVGLAKGAS